MLGQGPGGPDGDGRWTETIALYMLVGPSRNLTCSHWLGVLLARLRGQPRPQPGFAAEVPDLILGTQSIGSWDLWTVGPSRLSSLV